MPEARGPGLVAAWVVAGVLLLLFLGSYSMSGTWMGGVGMGWMMVAGILLLGAAGYVAYRFGRLQQKAEDVRQER